MTSNENKEDNQPSTILHYALSDKNYIDMDWTKLPQYKNVTNGFNDYVLFETQPWNCFRKRIVSKPYLYYPDGQLAANFNKNGTGFIYYLSGSPAIEFRDSNLNGQRILLYKDALQRNDSINKKHTKHFTTELISDSLIGWLDPRGVCSICDDNGKPIITYDQFGGIIYGNDINKCYHWVWCIHHDGSLGMKDINSRLSVHNDYDPLKIRENRAVIREPENNLSKCELKTKSVGLKKSDNGITLSGLSVSTVLLKDFIISKHYISDHLGILPKEVLKCVVNDSMSLWISNQEKIDLCFASNGFINRIDVGVVIKKDNSSKRFYVNPCKHKLLPDFTSNFIKNKLHEARLHPK